MFKKTILPVLGIFFFSFLIFGHKRFFQGSELTTSIRIINSLLIVVFFYLNTFIHEFGHYIIGVLCRFSVPGIVIGNGKPFFSFKVFGLRWTITNGFGGGFAFYESHSIKRLKIRVILIFLGGIIAQTLSLLIVFLINGFSLKAGVQSNNIIWGECFIITTLLSLISNIIPYSFLVEEDGTVLDNDGKSLFQIFKMSPAEISKKSVNNCAEAHYFLKIRRRDRVLEVLERDKDKEGYYLTSRILLADSYMHSHNIDKAIEYYFEVIDHKDLDEKRSIVENNLAWCYLLKGDTESLIQADIYSKKVVSYKQKTKAIQSVLFGTRGTVLIEMGKLEEGVEILKTVINNTPIGKQAHPLNLLYHIYGNIKLGHLDEIPFILDRLKTNHYELKEGNKILVKRILERTDFFDDKKRMMGRFLKSRI